MLRRPVIIGIGEVLWDILPTGMKAGGAPINFVYHASKLGADGYAVSAVGNDKPGDELLNELNNNGINNIIERVNYPTGTVDVKLIEGIPNYIINEDVAWDYIPFTDQMKSIARHADAICFGTLAQRSETSRATIRSFIGLAPDSSFLIFDVNIRQHFYTKEIIEDSLKRCNVFKINEEELELLIKIFNINSDNLEEACRWFVNEYSLKYMILTAGSEYSTIYTPDSFSHIKTPKVKVVDTVGAGDSFTGAFIYALLEGKTLQEAHQQAVDRSAFVCTRAGAWV